MAHSPVVAAEEVSKIYPSGELKVCALADVSVQVLPADFMALAGPSGSGKTTLLNLLGAIDMPTSGQVIFEGKNIREFSEDELANIRAQKIGFIFQTFNLVPVLSALENVEYPLLLFSHSLKERKELARASLAKVGLTHYADHKPSQLSGGQRQRVAIARALVKSPSLILADEPTANLDRQTGAEIMALMEELNKKEGVTFVLSSHDPMVLGRVKKVLYLEDGKAVKQVNQS